MGREEWKKILIWELTDQSSTHHLQSPKFQECKRTKHPHTVFKFVFWEEEPHTNENKRPCIKMAVSALEENTVACTGLGCCGKCTSHISLARRPEAGRKNEDAGPAKT